MPIRILIVEDHAVTAEALATGLREAGMNVVGSVRTGAEAIAFLEREERDVVVMDLDLPERTAMRTGRAILERWPEMKLLLVNSILDRRDAELAMEADFHGYLTKDASIDEIRSAIEAVMGGDVWLQLPKTDQPSISDEADAAPLTPIEREVLRLLVDGLDWRTIAARLELRKNEVRDHMGAILTKLNVHSRLEAATFWPRQDTSADHPHLDPMNDQQLLAHLHSMHSRGIAPYYPMDLDSLEGLHAVLHRQIPPSPA
jgi:DNA-binding NarL/FixJ family response regulator